MSVISNINDIDLKQWKQLVAESFTASWFQTKEAYDFYASLPAVFEPFIVAIQEHDTSLRGLCLGYVTKEENPLKQFFTRRAIIYAGPLLANDATSEEVECLMQQVVRLVKKKAIYIETRNFGDYSPWKEAFEHAKFTYRPHYDIQIACDTLDNMFARMQEGKRRQINKAQQEGARYEVIEGNGHEADVHAYYLLLKQLYQKKVRTPLYPELFFQHFVANAIGKLLLIKQDNHIIGGMLCPILANRAIYEWFVVGDVMATWAAMEYAQQHNLPVLELMGAGEPGVPYGVRNFKMAMGGELKEYGRFIHINSSALYKLGKRAIQVLKML